MAGYTDLTEGRRGPRVDEERPDLPGVGRGGNQRIHVPDHHHDLHLVILNIPLVPHHTLPNEGRERKPAAETTKKNIIYH